jgi:hypothetical protein
LYIAFYNDSSDIAKASVFQEGQAASVVGIVDCFEWHDVQLMGLLIPTSIS